MKKLLRCMILFFVLCSQAVHAQNETIVLNFSATEFNGKVLLSWAVTQGNTCNGIVVHRGSDTSSFVQIGAIEGICGSTAETIKYEFTDPNPMLNSTNYYRLSLGGIGFSYVVKVDAFDAGDQAFLFHPNPLLDESQLIFDNDNQEVITILVYGESGQIMREMKTSAQSIKIERGSLGEGVYFFQLRSENNRHLTSGKFIVR